MQNEFISQSIWWSSNRERNLLAKRKMKLSNMERFLPCQAVWHIPLLIYVIDVLSKRLWSSERPARCRLNRGSDSQSLHIIKTLVLHGCCASLWRDTPLALVIKQNLCDSAFFWEKIFLIFPGLMPSCWASGTPAWTPKAAWMIQRQNRKQKWGRGVENSERQNWRRERYLKLLAINICSSRRFEHGNESRSVRRDVQSWEHKQR